MAGASRCRWQTDATRWNDGALKNALPGANLPRLPVGNVPGWLSPYALWHWTRPWSGIELAFEIQLYLFDADLGAFITQPERQQVGPTSELQGIDRID